VPRRYGRIALAAGLAAAVALAVILLRPRPDSLPAAASRDFARVRSGALALTLKTESPGAMEAFFVRQGLPFRTRVFDLGMMGYRLEGGRVHALAGRPSGLFAYRGPDGRRLVCEMYEGTMRDLPPASESRSHGGFEFHVYRRGNRTLVFWQEGAISCVLVGDAASEDVIQLAFAKAMKAS
jgi:anti-sigma factor RsiW